MPTTRGSCSSAGYKYLCVFAVRSIWRFHTWVQPTFFPRITHVTSRWDRPAGLVGAAGRATCGAGRGWSAPSQCFGKEGGLAPKQVSTRRWAWISSPKQCRLAGNASCPQRKHGWGGALFTSVSEHLFTFIPQHGRSKFISLTCLSEVKGLPPKLLPPQMLP